MSTDENEFIIVARISGPETLHCGVPLRKSHTFFSVGCRISSMRSCDEGEISPRVGDLRITTVESSWGALGRKNGKSKSFSMMVFPVWKNESILDIGVVFQD